MRKLAILYGGPGGEHEVSVKSAENILDNVDRSKYELKSFFLPKKTRVLSKKIINELKGFLVWPIFHGEFGEGGYVQSVLEKNKIKHVGSSSKVSALTIDKYKTQKLLEKHGINCPISFVVKKISDLGKIKINYPIIIKPINGGSSVDLVKAKTKEEASKNLPKLLKKYEQVLVQEFVSGRELTCGVLDIKKKTLSLPVTEIVLTKTELFDYSAKYDKGGCLEVTPAQISALVRKKVQATAKKVHRVTGCRDVSRTDMIITAKGKIYVLEINTIPGMTKASLVPQQLEKFDVMGLDDTLLEELKKKGISIKEFIDIVVENHL